MKKCLLFFLLFCLKSHAEKLQLVTGEFPPFVGHALKHEGMTSEMVALIFAQMGEQVEINFKPWKRGYIETLQGTYLASFPYSKNDKREKEVYFSDTIYELNEYFFARRSDHLSYNKETDLKGLKVCKPIGYNLFGLKQLIDKKIINLSRPKSMILCFKMLKRGRIDLVMTNNIVGWRLVNKIFSDKDDVTMLAKSFTKISHHLIISKANIQGKKMIKAFNTALAKLKIDGTIKRIRAKYIP